MDNIKEIIGRIKETKGLTTNTSIAQYLGVSYNTLNTWIKRGKFPEEIIKRVVQDEQLSYDWLLTGQKNTESETKTDDSVSLSVSLLQAGAGEGVYNFETQHKLLTLSPNYFPFLTKEDIVAVEIVGESMEPVLRQGDYILITPSKEERATEDGIYAIRVEGMVKVKLLQFKLDGTIKIISYNKEFDAETYDPKQTQIDFSIIGKKRLLISR